MNIPKYYADEFLGKQIKVENSSDRLKIGIKGFVYNETKKMFFIKTKDGIKKIPKEYNVFLIDGNIMEGNLLNYNPEDRIKKMFK
jgi:RNase P/RNase MRP subunit p29